MSYGETYAAFSWQHSLGFGTTVSLDRSTDPFQVDDALTADIESSPESWLSMSLNARLNRYDAVLFLGERRGGTACTAGTCYQVLPFKGLELRINTYF